MTLKLRQYLFTECVTFEFPTESIMDAFNVCDFLCDGIFQLNDDLIE